MIILVINSGSSIVKFQVIEITDVNGDLRQQQKGAHGLVDRIGAAASYSKLRAYRPTLTPHRWRIMKKRCR